MAPQVLNNRGTNNYNYPYLLLTPFLVFAKILLKLYITICIVDIITNITVRDINNIDSKSIKKKNSKTQGKGKSGPITQEYYWALGVWSPAGLVETKSTRDIADSTFTRQLGLKAARTGREVEKVYENYYFGEMCAFLSYWNYVLEIFANLKFDLTWNRRGNWEMGKAILTLCDLQEL